MLQLYLMRHAKSDWNNYDGDDLKRKVSPIGEKKTQLTKEFILSKNFLPDHVWCSPSIRTKETLEILANIFSDKINIEYIDQLYNHGMETIDTLIIKSEIYKKNTSVKKLLVIGHEPFMSNSVQALTKDRDNFDVKSALNKFSTSSFFAFQFNTDSWYEISELNSEPLTYFRPRL